MKKKSLKKKKRLKIGKKAKRIKIIKKRKKSIKIKKKPRKTKNRKKYKKSVFKRKNIDRRRKQTRRIVKRVKKFKKSKYKKKRKKTRKTKKKKLKLKPKTSKRLSKVKFKRIKIFKFRNQINQIKKITFQKVINFVMYPFFRAYFEFKEKRKFTKLQKLRKEAAKYERELKLREKIRKDLLKKEIKEEENVAKKREKELRQVLKKEQKIIRQNEKAKQRQFAEDLQISKKLEKFAEREKKEILSLQKLTLHYEKSEWKQVQDRIDAIRQRYAQLRNERVKKRVEELSGITFSDQESIEEIRKKEKEIIEKREQITSALEGFYRSVKSVLHTVNLRHLPKNADLLILEDLRFEESEIIVREDSQVENFLILIYLENNSPSGKIIVEDKCNEEKHITRKYDKNQILRFGENLIDSVIFYLEKLRQQNKKDN